MAPRLSERTLCLVTDARMVGGAEPMLAIAESAVEGGVNMVILRENWMERSQLRAYARRMISAFKGRSKLVIHSDAALAAEVNADGVHFPSNLKDARLNEELRGKLLVGRSVHSAAEIEECLDDTPPSYFLLGSVYPSRTHLSGYNLSKREVSKSLQFGERAAVLAIGGINGANAQNLIAMGFRGVAVIRAIALAESPRAAAAALAAAIGRSAD